MINEEKIALMTKLAIYDKKYGENDKGVNDLYYRDYVYRRNFYVRTMAFLGCLIPIGLYAIYIILHEDTDFFALDYTQMAIRAGLFILVVMLAYTIIGTSIATAEYAKIKHRLKDYFGIIKKLEDLKEGNTQENEEDL